MDSSNKPAAVKRNAVWKNALQEQNLCEEIKKFGAFNSSDKTNLVSIERGVESYEYALENSVPPGSADKTTATTAAKNHLSVTVKAEDAAAAVDRKPELEERLGEAVSFDANKSRSHVHVTELDTEQAVAKEIAKQLCENNLEIISRCVKVLGRKKSLEILFATQDIEEIGGMFTSDGNRRRSPGGVYLQLIKRDDSILTVQKKQIFIEDEDKKKKKKIVKRLKQKAKFEIAKKVLHEQVKRDGQKEKVSPNNTAKDAQEADDMNDLQEDEMIYFDE